MHSEGFSPMPPSERGQWALALALFLLGVGGLVAVLSGAVGSSVSPATADDPPAMLADAVTPTAASDSQTALLSKRETAAEPYAEAAGRRSGRLASGMAVGVDARQRPFSTEPSGARGQSAGSTEGYISASWEAGFYSIYGEAQRVFGVDWLLLASIHKQESAFSTAPSTYHGLNFAGCCGGPMQFNVTNGPISTWDLVRNAYRYGRRPAVYEHRTAQHPSIYDDFDSIMAAAWLLSSDGASRAGRLRVVGDV
jgi:hypothetical protein